MKAYQVVTIVAFALATLTLNARWNATADSCAGGYSLAACNNQGSTTVTGVSGPGPSGIVDTQSGPSVGEIQYVACGANALSRLEYLQVSGAREYAADCASWNQRCAAIETLAHLGLTQTNIRLIYGKDQRWSYYSTTCDAPAKPVVTADLVRARVVRLVPSAGVGLAPKASTLVNIQTVMWVAAPASRDLPVVQILGQRVVVHLAFDHVQWVFGDGVRDDAGPAGKAYDAVSDPCRTRLCPSYFGHVYLHTGRVRVTATVLWRASFTVDGGGEQQILGTDRPPAPRSRMGRCSATSPRSLLACW